MPQRKNVEEGPKRGKEVSAAAAATAPIEGLRRHCCNGSTILEKQNRGNGTNAVAGATFLGAGKIRIVKTHMKDQLVGRLCVKKQYAKGCRLFSDRHQGREEGGGR